MITLRDLLRQIEGDVLVHLSRSKVMLSKENVNEPMLEDIMNTSVERFTTRDGIMNIHLAKDE